MAMSPRAAHHMARSLGPFFSLSKGSYMSVSRHRRGLRGKALFFFHNGFVDLPRHGPAGGSSRAAVFNHHHHHIARVFVRPIGTKPNDVLIRTAGRFDLRRPGFSRDAEIVQIRTADSEVEGIV